MNPREAFGKMTTMITAWANLRSAKIFSGRTLEKFKATVQPSYDVRIEIQNLETQLAAAVTRRDAADRASVAEMRAIVLGVRADPEEGEDGELYSAMGYVRRSERGSGLTRRTTADAAKSKDETTA